MLSFRVTSTRSRFPRPFSWWAVSRARSAVVDPHRGDDEASRAAGQSRAGALETVKAVLWSFFGVRGRAGHERDMERLNPVYVILTGVVLAILFVLGLIGLVRWVVA